MTLEHDVSIGARAKEILENEVFNTAFEQIEKEIYQAWKSSPRRDVEGREQLALMQVLLERVKQMLINTMESGTVAKDQLYHKRTMLERSRAFLSDLVSPE